MNSGDSQTQLAHYVQQQQWLLEVVQHIASSAGLNETIPHILSGIEHGLRADCVRLLIGTASNVRQTFGAGAVAVHAPELDVALLARVPVEGEMELVRAADRFAALDDVMPESLANVTALPLTAQESVLGVLWLGFKEAHPLDDGERVFLRILAGQAAVAIANAESYEAARKRREWLAAVLISTPDPVLVVDREQRLQLVNPAAQDAFAGLDALSIDKPLTSVDGLADLTGLFDGRKSTDPAERVEFTAKNGNVYAPRISEIRTEKGSMTGWVLVLRDITSFKRVNQNMSEFLSTVSHDMRSPLTFMKGYCDMLGMVGELNEKQIGFADKIAVGVVQMSDMVEKILDAAKIDPVTGSYTLSREACDMVELVEKIMTGLAEPAARRRLIVHQLIDAGAPVMNVDRAMISSAYTNLVENAIKYTPEGGEVEVELAVDRAKNELRFRVKDNGLGISEADQHKLFQRNVRIRRQEWKRVKGSGLGLFIVKNVAQRHGGDAWVQSVPGNGSTFTMTLPMDGLNMIAGEAGTQA